MERFCRNPKGPVYGEAREKQQHAQKHMFRHHDGDRYIIAVAFILTSRKLDLLLFFQEDADWIRPDETSSSRMYACSLKSLGKDYLVVANIVTEQTV